MKRGILMLLVLFISVSGAIGQNWLTDFSMAKEKATSENRPIVLVFQGSDWCAPCIKLDREIWTTDTFKNYAKENYVLLKADFPRKKKGALSSSQALANAELAERYNRQGIFPLVVLLDQNGNVLGETGYKKTTPELYIEELKSFVK